MFQSSNMHFPAYDQGINSMFTFLVKEIEIEWKKVLYNPNCDLRIEIFEPPHQKTNNLHMLKPRRRSAVQ